MPDCAVHAFRQLVKVAVDKARGYYAESQQKRIVPVLVNGDKLRGWFQFNFGNVDYISIRSKEHKEKLISNLRNWLGVDEEERKAAEEAKRIGHKSTPDSTPGKRERLRLWIQKRKKWLAASFLTIAAIIGFSVYAYLHRIVEASDYHEGMARVENGMGYFGFKDESGKVVIPCQWKDAWPFSDGLARVMDTSGKWGFIDKAGELVIPCQWKAAYDFSEGLAQVENNNDKWGYIDKTGKLVIPCKWEWAEKFTNGQASVQDDQEKWWKIDNTGKIVREETP